MAYARSLAAALAALLLLAPLVVGLAALVDLALGQVGFVSVWLGVATCAVVVTLVAVARGGLRDAGDSESVWAFVPSWQYTGRHVESGGLTRDEQEAALADVEEQAEQCERGSL